MRVVFDRRGLGYEADFPEAGVMMSLDRLRTTGGELKAELTVEVAEGTKYDGPIVKASFNVSSLTARRSMAKTCASRCEVAIDWEEALERLCIATLEAERAGEPIEPVGQLTREDKDAYLLEPYLLRNRVSILYGQGGSGKSYFAAALAVAVATGKSPIPGTTYPPTSYPGPVVILDWEADKAEWNERLQDVSLGMGQVPPANLMYRACAGPFVDIAEQMAAFVRDEKVPLVIVDSAGLAAPPKDGDPAENAIRMFAGFRLLSTSILLIDHVTGDDVDKKVKVHKPYGSIYKVNMARTVFELKRGPEDPDGTRHISVHHRKVNRGALRDPVGFAVHHDTAEVNWKMEPK